MEKPDLYDFESLADYIDYSISDKLENHCRTNEEKSIYFHIRTYIRYMQLQMNLLRSKIEVTSDMFKAMAFVMPEPAKPEMLKKFDSLVKERQMKAIKELQEKGYD